MTIVDRLHLLVRINNDSDGVRIRFDALAEHYLKADFGAAPASLTHSEDARSLYAEQDSDEARAAQGAFLRALGMPTEQCSEFVGWIVDRNWKRFSRQAIEKKW